MMNNQQSACKFSHFSIRASVLGSCCRNVESGSMLPATCPAS